MRQRASRISVLLADDHPLYQDGVAAAIQRRPDFELVGRASTGREALEGIRALRPAVALVDVRMPDLTGIDLVKAVRRDELPTRVILLSAAVEPELVHAAIAAGVRGYLVKEVGRDEICETVAAVAHGSDTILSPAVQQALVAGVMLHTDAAPNRPVLSPREREVIELMAEGHTVGGIASKLVLGEATIKTHQRNVYEKLGVHDRAAAVAAALRLGLLE
jgi:two-component system nitrate/nitrite response regulator NarL